MAGWRSRRSTTSRSSSPAAAAPAEIDRVLATVMFTDIVGSTEHASRSATAAGAPARPHNAVVRDELDRWRGKEVKTIGDGFLATFDGPARAVQCAASIVDEVRELGLELRVGLHTGECELVGRDVAGIAVHIGARVMANAGRARCSRRARSRISSSARAPLRRPRPARAARRAGRVAPLRARALGRRAA